ncbi:isocitrate lyase/phosphoenolpyruvate mutase family protein [Streptomyces albiaxialis]|uniref:Isocitrate lyase/phosphoenolpyruvate mutase family protein n=1 Tax=Streptomyces albiaxialis TaxID=329523 RepID=A0ABN2WUM5_9ACTN
MASVLPLNDRCRALRALHEDGVLVLPNAWDAASAVLVAALGARAVATTSGGLAWSLGRADGQALTREETAAAVARIAAVVDVPVTADIEGGYGPAPEDVAATVAAVAAAGAAGINLEDSRAPGGPLFTPAEQAERLRAARTAAVEAGVPDLVVNARTDVVLFGIGEPETRLDAVRERASVYAEAGADCLFVPGLLDLEALSALAAEVPLPVNAMAVPGGPDVAALRAAGVRRVSTGTALAQAAYGTVRRATAEILAKGTYTECEGALDFGELNARFTLGSGD